MARKIPIWEREISCKMIVFWSGVERDRSVGDCGFLFFVGGGGGGGWGFILIFFFFFFFFFFKKI